MSERRHWLREWVFLEDWVLIDDDLIISLSIIFSLHFLVLIWDEGVGPEGFQDLPRVVLLPERDPSEDSVDLSVSL